MMPAAERLGGCAKAARLLAVHRCICSAATCRRRCAHAAPRAVHAVHAAPRAPVLGMSTTSMKPTGYVLSVRVLPSTCGRAGSGRTQDVSGALGPGGGARAGGRAAIRRRRASQQPAAGMPACAELSLRSARCCPAVACSRWGGVTNHHCCESGAALSAAHLHQTLHEDRGDLLAGQCVLEAVAQQQDQRQALARLVRAGAGLGGLRAGKTRQGAGRAGGGASAAAAAARQPAGG